MSTESSHSMTMKVNLRGPYEVLLGHAQESDVRQLIVQHPDMLAGHRHSYLGADET